MAIFSTVCKPDNFVSHISLKLNFTNIHGFYSNFVGYESFLQPNSLIILAIYEKNLEDSEGVIFL